MYCVTDLVTCCDDRALGDWYHPDGSRVGLDEGSGVAAFQRNRGQNEVITLSATYGSIHLWRKWTPRQTLRGLFCCELPDASGVNQTLCVNICEFPHNSFVPASCQIVVCIPSTCSVFSVQCCYSMYSLSGHLS